jgi:hypothetical protein
MSQIQNHVPARKAELFPSHEQALRAALEWIRARHDSGAISPPVFSVMRMIEVELSGRRTRRLLSWLAHRGEAAP